MSPQRWATLRPVRALLLAFAAVVGACGARTGALDDGLSDGGVPSDVDAPVCNGLPDSGYVDNCRVGRAIVWCPWDSGGEVCLSDSVTSCTPSTAPSACVDQCASNEYGIACYPSATAPIHPPPSCRAVGALSPVLVVPYCCPCGM